MSYQRDEAKARRNHRKHGLDFADAVAVFEDEGALTVKDSEFTDEERWIPMGLDSLSRVLVVVYTWRGDQIRLISARIATPRERMLYGRPE